MTQKPAYFFHAPAPPSKDAVGPIDEVLWVSIPEGPTDRVVRVATDADFERFEAALGEFNAKQLGG